MIQSPGVTEAFSFPFMELPDLLNERMGGKALAANDEFFAPKENLVKASAPIFIVDKYTEFGKWMDGWESRRKRNLGPGNDHDWCLLKLGVAGTLRGFDVDTAFFTGNYPEFCSIEACAASDGASAAELEKAQWKVVLPKSKLKGGTHNLFAVADEGRYTHLRLRIFPDGGVARLRVYGEPRPDWSALRSSKSPVDLAAVLNGGRVVTCNDMFFGPKENLIMPGRAATMGEGWETKRKRGPGFDWIVVRLGASGRVAKIEVDTNHFKGNFPESCSIEGCVYPKRDLEAADFRDRKDLVWKELLPRTKLQAHTQHYFEKELAAGALGEAYDYLRLNIYPDGGVSRLRVWGAPA